MIKRRIIKSLVLCFLPVILGACATISAPQYRLNYRVVAQGKSVLPKRVVLLGMRVSVRRFTSGGVAEPVKEWELNGKKNLQIAIDEYARTNNEFQLIKLPTLLPHDQARVDESTALLFRVSDAAVSMPQFSAWESRFKKFDYTIGPSLSFLQQKTGAEAALIVYGYDLVSSGGRVASQILMSGLFGSLPSFGRAYMYMAIVDLRTGDILWANNYSDRTNSFRKLYQAKLMVSHLMKSYPGIDAYAKYVKAKSR